MASDTGTKASLLQRIDREGAAWDALLAEVGEDRMELPGAAGDWTFKDVVGHLNGWRMRTLDRLEHADAPPPPPWPADLDVDSDEGVEAINRWLYDRNRDRPAADLVAESRQQLTRLREAVAARSEQELTEPLRYPWLGGEPLSAVVEGSFGHLHEEHEPAIRAWLARESEATSSPAGSGT